MAEVIFWLFVVVTVVTLVGHGIWVFVALLGRAVFGSGPGGRRAGRTARPCPFCGRPTPDHLERCDFCGRRLASPLAEELSDLAALERQLSRFRESGALRPDVVAKLRERVRAYRQRLLMPREEIVPVEVVREPERAEPERRKPEVVRPETAKPQAALGEKPPVPKPQAPKPIAPPPIAPKPIAPTPVAPSRPARPPRKPWRVRFAELLADRDIHWTEAIGVLVGGLLMVCSSVMLVVSLWSALAQIPPLKFFIFIGYSTLVFAAGLYAYHRWKLPSTGRGLLVIATLLVPLDFLAMASLRQGWDPLTVGAELVSLGVCLWLVWLAARVLVPEGTWLTSVAVVGNSAALLLLGRLIGETPSETAVLLGGCVPVALFAAAVLGYLATGAGRRRELDAPGAAASFTLLGVSAFAAGAAVVPLVARGAKSLGLATVTDLLAVPLALAAVPVLAVGLKVMRGTESEKGLAAQRTAGTMVALLGMAVSLAALGFAWPVPAGLMAVGLLSAAGLAWAAWQYRFPLFHAGAIACLGVAYVVGVHWCFEETLRSPPARDALGLALLKHAISARTGTALAALVALLAAASEGLARLGRRQDGRIYAAGAGVGVLLGLLLVTMHGLLGGGPDAIRAAVLYGIYGALSLLLAARWRRVELSYLGLLLLAAAPFWALWWRAPEITPVWAVVLAGESLLMSVVAATLDYWTQKRGDQELTDWIARVFGKPLARGGVLCSLLALAVLPLAGWSGTATLAACLASVAVAWLAVAWRERSALWFAAHQAMLILAALVGTTAWLEGRAWVTSVPQDLFHPASLQAYGMALAVLGLAWLVVRMSLRGNATARRLIEPGWPEVDWCVRHAVVWLQLLLAAWWLLPGVTQELWRGSSTPGALQQAASGGGAWLLLGLLGTSTAVALWQRWGRAELVSAILLVAALGCLVAGPFAADRAAASALRWALSAAFVIGSAAVWARRPLADWLKRVKTRIELDEDAPHLARGTLLATTALPVLALTLLAASLQLTGTSPAGPAGGTFFDRLGPSGSYLVPLVLVMLSLVGHAVRERSAGYAFGGGLVAEMIVVLGYALRVVTTGDRAFDTGEFVLLVQLATITAAAWAAVWLVVRPQLDVWRETPEAPAARHLMNVQIGLGAAGNALLLVVALTVMFLGSPHHEFHKAWTAAVGSAWGWVALAAVVAVWAYRRLQNRESLRPEAVGLVGMAALELLACTVGAQLGGWWGYRTLMLSWAAFAWFIVAATWWVATVRTLPGAHGPPQALLRAASVWVRVAGTLAVLLGLRAAVFREADVELLWSAAAVSVASLAGATMAVWRRREGWAFAAALGVNVAASLVVWYARVQEPFADWWLRLVQANVIASAAVALTWLAVRRRLYKLREIGLRESPLLAVQTLLPVLGNAALLAAPLPWLLGASSYLPEGMAQLAEWPGWLGLLLTAAAAAWYLRQVRPEGLMHVLGGLSLGGGILAACAATTANGLNGPRPWLELHTLMTAWAAAALVVLAVGFTGRKLRLAFAEAPGDAPSPPVGRPLFPERLTEGWTAVIGLLVVLLAVSKAVHTAQGFWWSAGPVLAVSVAAGLIALWLRRPAYVYASGLLLNLVGVIAWLAWTRHDVYGFLEVNALCLAAGAVAWTLIELFVPRGMPHPNAGDRALPFAHVGVRAGVALIGAAVGLTLLGELFGREAYQVTRLDWAALAATGAAAALLLWDRASRFPLAGLYAVGLLAVGLGRVGDALTPREMAWVAGVDLAGIALIGTLLGLVLPILGPVWRALGIRDTTADGSRRWSDAWFLASQAVVAAMGAVLALWIALDGRFDGVAAPEALPGLAGRAAAVVGAIMLTLTALLMAGQSQGRWRRAWQHATLAAAVLLLGTVGWSLLSADSAAFRLHAEVVLLVAAVAVALLAGLGLRWILPPRTDWADAGRRATPALGALSAAALLMVLLHEGALFLSTGEVPMQWPAIAVVCAALATLLGACLAFAAVGRWDPLGLSDSGRQAYVYAAEVLGVLIGLHLYLTMPWLFRLGIVEKYWMLLVMAVAFAGAGLSELFRRRGLSVLSIPLERTALALPLVPAIGFWLTPAMAGAPLALAGPSPATWILMGAFYGMMARMRRSLGCGVAGIASATIGVWVLWARLEINIAEHPQLWLIPPALAALVAEYLNRDRLTAGQSAAFRYLALGIIYVSSTADMFIAGIGEDWRLPLVLMLLSVAGILAGFLLRVQSFLLLGFVFLVVDLATMVGYAAFGLDYVWVFWAAALAVSVGIIALFAVIERRRQEVFEVVGRFKQWQR